MSGKKGKSGGAREGAGRPREKKTISEKVKNNYLKAAQELAEEYGEPIEKAVLRLIFEDGVQDTVKIAALKEYTQALIIKESEKSLNINNESETPCGPIILSKEEMDAYRILKHRIDELSNPRPSIILPERLPDPAKQIAPKKEPKKNKVIRLKEKK